MTKASARPTRLPLALGMLLAAVLAIPAGASAQAEPPANKERMRERIADWENMTPQQKREARANYKRARELPPEEREARWRAYQSMTPEQRQAWAERARPGSSGGQGARRPPPPDFDAQTPKSNIVGANPSGREGRGGYPPSNWEPGGPGATRNPINRPPSPPPHQQSGMPKITASPDYVDRSTLLPQRGPQGVTPRQGPPASGPNRKK
jgi:hypothetical protein